ncbi:MAG TPA: TPM domain-containing protein [Burkholderiales bacterium]|nr:TPM domain-containing protein [Burkholderiales bacterium]
MSAARTLRHLLATPGAVRRAFPPAALAAIAQAIEESEHQIRFAVEAGLDVGPLLRGESARARAIEVFSELRVWDTEHNNGVLVYLLLADRDVEIVADRGISARVPVREWTRICAAMEARLAAGRYQHAVVEGIRDVARLLAG